MQRYFDLETRKSINDLINSDPDLIKSVHELSNEMTKKDISKLLAYYNTIYEMTCFATYNPKTDIVHIDEFVVNMTEDMTLEEFRYAVRDDLRSIGYVRPDKLDEFNERFFLDKGEKADKISERDED